MRHTIDWLVRSQLLNGRPAETQPACCVCLAMSDHMPSTLLIYSTNDVTIIIPGNVSTELEATVYVHYDFILSETWDRLGRKQTHFGTLDYPFRDVDAYERERLEGRGFGGLVQAKRGHRANKKASKVHFGALLRRKNGATKPMQRILPSFGLAPLESSPPHSCYCEDQMMHVVWSCRRDSEREALAAGRSRQAGCSARKSRHRACIMTYISTTSSTTHSTVSTVSNLAQGFRPPVSMLAHGSSQLSSSPANPKLSWGRPAKPEMGARSRLVNLTGLLLQAPVHVSDRPFFFLSDRRAARATTLRS